MTRPTRWVSAVLALTLVIAACADDDDPDASSADTTPDTSTETTAEPAEAEAHYPVTLENCGREVVIEQRPERVLIMNGSSYSESTTMAALGLEDTVVANAQPPLGVSDAPGIAETVAAMPTGGIESDPTTFEVTREGILDQRPDLVLSVWSGGFTGDFGAGITRDELDELGIDTYVSRPQCGFGTEYQELPDVGHEASYQLIEDLGIIFDVEDEATALIEEQQTTIAAAQSLAADRDEPVRVAVLSTRFADFWPNGVAGINTFPVTSTIVESAGGVNAFDDFNASLETMVATDVDFLVFSQLAGESDVEAAVDELFAQFPEWDAARNDAWVAVSDGIFFGATQHIAVERIATAIAETYPA